jgi:membrane associated rhomboid family serine protease
MGRGSGSPVFELLLMFIVVYLLQVVTAFANLVGGLFVLSPPIDQNPWTVVTSVYAHGSPGHLISNAVALILVGWPVARATTRIRFHAFFLATGAIAGVAQIVLTDLLASLPLIGGSETAGVLGASGAVFALLGYLLASNRLTTSVATVARVPVWLGIALFVIVAGLLTFVTASPGVALVAHFTGLFVGLVAGRLAVLDPGTTAR